MTMLAGSVEWLCPEADLDAHHWFSASAARPRLDVLLVEDDHDIADMYRRRFVRDGLSVVIAPDAATGLQHFHSHDVGVVLLDIRLPGEDGFHVLESIKATPRGAGTPVLVLSNFGEQVTVQRALELGAADYLIKAAITPSDVAARVRSYLGGPRAD